MHHYPDGTTVEFYGFEVLQYYLQKFLLYFSDYSLPIRLLFGMILLCLLTLLVLFVLFILKIRSNRQHERALKSANRHLREGFYHILVSGTNPTIEDLETACNMTLEHILLYPPEILSHVISDICMELSNELAHIPGADVLCTLTEVKTYYERNLASRHHVLSTLQNLVNMHIRVSEGLLTLYTSHYDRTIRHMARMCHIISATTDPYSYFLEDLNEKQSLWRPMMLHRLFGWLHANDRQMPQFLNLSEMVRDDEVAAFLIEEVAYWGSPHEKALLHTFFLSPKYRCRQAALHAVTLLRDGSQEQAAIDSYDRQPEHIRREVLKAVYAIGSGRHTPFFVEAYHASSSKATRETALTCLYSYGQDGRRTFDLLRASLMQKGQDSTLMDQIDAMSILNQIRMY